MSSGYGVDPAHLQAAETGLRAAQEELQAVSKALERAQVPDTGLARTTLAVEQYEERAAGDAGALAKAVGRTRSKVENSRRQYVSTEGFTAEAFGGAGSGVADSGERSVFG